MFIKVDSLHLFDIKIPKIRINSPSAFVLGCGCVKYGSESCDLKTRSCICRSENYGKKCLHCNYTLFSSHLRKQRFVFKMPLSQTVIAMMQTPWETKKIVMRMDSVIVKWGFLTRSAIIASLVTYLRKSAISVMSNTMVIQTVKVS